MKESLLGKIKLSDQLETVISKLKSDDKKIVYCHGVFDLIHLGHMRHLSSAKDFGDILVVSITADQHVKRGPGRPVFNQDLRAEALANLEITDYVFILNEPTAIKGIKTVKPDFYVKGPDYKNKSEDVTGEIYAEEKAVEQEGGKLVFTEDVTFSSSKLINNYLSTYPAQTSGYLKELSSEISAAGVLEKLEQLSKLKVLVIGDAIIDQYHYTVPLGKSSKENIVVNHYLSEEDFAGGVMATANHTAQIISDVDLITVLGKNKSYETFINDNLSNNINPYFFNKPDCVTTIKRRYVDQSSMQKNFEVYFFDDSIVTDKAEEQILDTLKSNIDNYDLVIVSDFGHGMFSPKIMNYVCENAKCLAINVQSNSANSGFNIVTKYDRADLVCIDEKELRLATRDKSSSLQVLMKQIKEELSCELIIVTRGAEGSMSYSEKEGFLSCPSLVEQGIDKIGAGDAFFAFVAPCFAANVQQKLLNFIGNAVGALAIQIVGNRESVKYVDLAKFITRLLKY